MKRRTFLKRTFWGFAGTGLLTGLYAWQVEPFWVEFVRNKMPIKNLPAHLVGKTLMQISDIHIGNKFDYRYIIDSFKKAQEFNPDFVVYTGDYVSLYNGNIQTNKLKEVLGNCVKGNLGTAGILGNHDYGKNWLQNNVADNISEMLRAHGVTVLRNEQVEINGLTIIGLDDYWGTNFNPQKALSKYYHTKPAVLLCHNPDVCDLDVWNNYQGWILCGHTHGGQCKPPFLPAPILPVKNKKYSAGKFELPGERTLYINRALGHLWQIRFNVRPEITIFELESA
jgi:predicted MPP superfamily phosphohydrolase